MEYKGYKLLDKILLVCKDKPEQEDSHGWYNNRNYYQAYLVDPSNKKTNFIGAFLGYLD